MMHAEEADLVAAAVGRRLLSRGDAHFTTWVCRVGDIARKWMWPSVMLSEEKPLNLIEFYAFVLFAAKRPLNFDGLSPSNKL